ncbi:MAG: hypothetical protein RMY28_025115 [Nostoc sp. ChiSLP01]|nr:hypothetical protein [Nostoc sp. CmiSLP01]MDZ8286658.1 hypothetical protein [Nostoc sp. ChiSLP01]
MSLTVPLAVPIKKLRHDRRKSNNSDEEEFDPVTDPRDWSAAETELACFALARSKGKRLVRNHQYQKTAYADYLCIFEDYSE